MILVASRKGNGSDVLYMSTADKSQPKAWQDLAPEMAGMCMRMIVITTVRHEDSI